MKLPTGVADPRGKSASRCNHASSGGVQRHHEDRAPSGRCGSHGSCAAPQQPVVGRLGAPGGAICLSCGAEAVSAADPWGFGRTAKTHYRGRPCTRRAQLVRRGPTDAQEGCSSRLVTRGRAAASLPRPRRISFPRVSCARPLTPEGRGSLIRRSPVQDEDTTVVRRVASGPEPATWSAVGR